MTNNRSGNTRNLLILAGLVVLTALTGWFMRAESYRADAVEDRRESGAQSDGAIDTADARSRALATKRRTSPASGQEPGPVVATQATREDSKDSASSQARREEADLAPAPDADRDISPMLGRSLSGIIELLNAERFDEALAQLEPLMRGDLMAQMTPFERSRLYQLSFNLNMSAQNYEGASADIQAALESGGLDAREYDQMVYQRAQLFVQMEDYAKAADSLELWINESPNPNKGAHYLLAASYYYQQKYDDARDVMEGVFAMPGENQEAWYQMMTALYMQNEDYARAKPVLEKMVELFDNPAYRDQLKGVEMELSGTQ